MKYHNITWGEPLAWRVKTYEQFNPLSGLFLFIMKHHDYMERSSWVLTQKYNWICFLFCEMKSKLVVDYLALRFLFTIQLCLLLLLSMWHYISDSSYEKEFKFFRIGGGTEMRTLKNISCSRRYSDLHQGVSYIFVAKVISLFLLFVLHYLVPFSFCISFITNIFQRKNLNLMLLQF